MFGKLWVGIEVGGKATLVAIAIEGNQTEVTPTTLPASRRLSTSDRRLPGTRRKGNAEGSAVHQEKNLS